MPTVHTTAVAARAVRRLVTVLAVCAAVPGLAGADPVMEWNDIARQLVVVPAQSPVQQTRLMAIVHVAMPTPSAESPRVREYVAAQVRAKRRHCPPKRRRTRQQSPRLPRAQRTLRAVRFPRHEYAASLAGHGVSPTDPGIASDQPRGGYPGARQHDGAAKPPTLPAAERRSVWWSGPRSVRPDRSGAAARWGDVAPFVLRRGSQFRPEAPPPLHSRRYARDYNEIAQVGAASVPRAPMRDAIALFWRASPTALWNPVLRGGGSRKLTLSEDRAHHRAVLPRGRRRQHRVLEAKYYYNYWRPQPANPAGCLDGNAATGGDAAWLPLVPTRPPEYPSGHTANSGPWRPFCGCLFATSGFVIEATSLRTSDSSATGRPRRGGAGGESTRGCSPAFTSATRTRFGARMGRQVARFVMTHALRRVKKH